ncbi:MAG: amidohydrolase family protein [Alphaproteobacteria bacterium]
MKPARIFLSCGMLIASGLVAACEDSNQTLSPVIDVHVHADPVQEFGPPGQSFCLPFPGLPPLDAGKAKWPDYFFDMLRNPPCDNATPAAATDEELMRDTLAVLERRNVIGVVGGPVEHVAKWREAAPERVIPALRFNLARDAGITPEDIAKLHQDGKIEVVAEVTNQYAGFPPNAPEMEPYWAMAEENGIPVGIHIGTSPPGSAYMFEGHRFGIADPVLLEEVLVKHPNLRVWVMHAGYPLTERMIGMMLQYPQLYVGTGVLQVAEPRAAYYAMLKKMVDAGLGERIMFGSDQMMWPGIIEASIKAVEEAPLTEKQKRDILYNNAARFFRLSEEEIARHHAGLN